MSTTSVPRNEYPRPQCVRDEWLCLNGSWQFAADPSDSGRERGFIEAQFPDRIMVPFCPESLLSGIEDRNFQQAVWYRREQAIPAAWAGQRILLHFQAVDYDCTLWVNGTEVQRHRGGFTPFSADITAHAVAGETVAIVVRARDDGRQRKPQGKQNTVFANQGCHYTRTTGIWQTVWMEPVPLAVHLRRPRITPHRSQRAFEIQAPMNVLRPDISVRARLLIGQLAVAEASASACDGIDPRLWLVIPAEHCRTWSMEDPFLYDIELSIIADDGAIIDQVRSYAGLRSVSIVNNRVLINGQSVFQRLVLDQGYYPDGLMTAPSDEALIADISKSMELGFNGARLHQKVFEERFLYHADRLGYLVWGEFADWHELHLTDRPSDWGPAAYCLQWAEVLERDYSHPSLIGWCPTNETFIMESDRIDAFDDVVIGLYRITKLADSTRPIIDASGWSHRVPDADIYDIHTYHQGGKQVAEEVALRLTGVPQARLNGRPGGFQDIGYDVQAQRPFMVSEFGGIWWNAEAAAAAERENNNASWGYGNRVASIEEFYDRFSALCQVLIDDPQVFGYCYTQLTDVFQEQNGLYHFDRSQKFDPQRIRKAQVLVAAIEKE